MCFLFLFGAGPQTLLGELTALPQTSSRTSCYLLFPWYSDKTVANAVLSPSATDTDDAEAGWELSALVAMDVAIAATTTRSARLLPNTKADWPEAESAELLTTGVGVETACMHRTRRITSDRTQNRTLVKRLQCIILGMVLTCNQLMSKHKVRLIN